MIYFKVLRLSVEIHLESDTNCKKLVEDCLEYWSNLVESYLKRKFLNSKF